MILNIVSALALATTGSPQAETISKTWMRDDSKFILGETTIRNSNHSAIAEITLNPSREFKQSALLVIWFKSSNNANFAIYATVGECDFDERLLRTDSVYFTEGSIAKSTKIGKVVACKNLVKFDIIQRVIGEAVAVEIYYQNGFPENDLKRKLINPSDSNLFQKFSGADLPRLVP